MIEELVVKVVPSTVDAVQNKSVTTSTVIELIMPTLKKENETVSIVET
jgi:hypothetical protein